MWLCIHTVGGKKGGTVVVVVINIFDHFEDFWEPFSPLNAQNQTKRTSPSNSASNSDLIRNVPDLLYLKNTKFVVFH